MDGGARPAAPGVLYRRQVCWCPMDPMACADFSVRVGPKENFRANENGLSRSCNHNQFLAIGWCRTKEIAVLRLDCEAAQLEQMMQLPAIRPAERHFTSILDKNLSISSDFPVAPQIAADLCEMVEAGAQHLARIPAPSHRAGAGKHRNYTVFIHQ